MRILTVCLGNICRSPTAEAALRAVLPDAEIDSAGTAGWHVGKPPYAPMQAAAKAQGLDLSRLRARQFAVHDFARFDLILVMDAENAADVEALRPAENATRVAMMTDALGETEKGRAVPDPYYTRDFDGALDLIRRAAEAWAAELTS
ncbi:low molecular weight protein-tyrosine-phosphatase [Pseudaestuariivita sp.]|uniref:low molecular weight protein-tyrosine-phosphatase n=1 Tax=Pseudaestuariivita sp. TaxID=2211669 RepID=UPI0040580007